MTDRPIIFSGPMVRAILDGKKTQTRRVLRGVRADGTRWVFGKKYSGVIYDDEHQFRERGHEDEYCPYRVGDRLWVRETWKRDGADSIAAATADFEDAMGPQLGPTFYAADAPPMGPSRYWPSIHMPRWASRLTLTVTEVRVQRLQDISEEDAIADGAVKLVMEGDAEAFYLDHERGTHRCGFAGLWDHINGKREGATWDDNPWVVALTFTAEKRNIDAVKAEDDTHNERLISAARLDPL